MRQSLVELQILLLFSGLFRHPAEIKSALSAEVHIGGIYSIDLLKLHIVVCFSLFHRDNKHYNLINDKQCAGNYNNNQHTGFRGSKSYNRTKGGIIRYRSSDDIAFVHRPDLFCWGVIILDDIFALNAAVNQSDILCALEAYYCKTAVYIAQNNVSLSLWHCSFVYKYG